MTFNLKKDGKNLLILCVASFFMAVNIKTFVRTADLFPGGASGLTILIQRIAETYFDVMLPYTLINLLLNAVPVYVGFRFIGKKFTLYSCLMIVMTSVLTDLIPAYIITYDKMLISVFGGIINGFVISLCLRMNATTGGTDLLCALIHKRLKHYSVPQLLIVVDGLIVLSGVAVFGINESLYAAIAIFITAKMSDGILEGLKFSKMAYIISEKYENIAREIMQELDRGVTALHATGMYSKKEKTVLLCVVSKKEIAGVLDVVNRHDRDAFVIVSDAREVMGEGFIENVQ